MVHGQGLLKMTPQDVQCWPCGGVDAISFSCPKLQQTVAGVGGGRIPVVRVSSGMSCEFWSHGALLISFWIRYSLSGNLGTRWGTTYLCNNTRTYTIIISWYWSHLYLHLHLHLHLHLYICVNIYVSHIKKDELGKVIRTSLIASIFCSHSSGRNTYHSYANIVVFLNPVNLLGWDALCKLGLKIECTF